MATISENLQILKDGKQHCKPAKKLLPSGADSIHIGWDV